MNPGGCAKKPESPPQASSTCMLKFLSNIHFVLVLPRSKSPAGTRRSSRVLKLDKVTSGKQDIISSASGRGNCMLHMALNCVRSSNPCRIGCRRFCQFGQHPDWAVYMRRSSSTGRESVRWCAGGMGDPERAHHQEGSDSTETCMLPVLAQVREKASAKTWGSCVHRPACKKHRH